MGCSSSSGELTKFIVNESIAGQGQRTVDIAKSLGVTKKDLNKLFKAFVSLDEVRLKTGLKQQGKEQIEDFLERITTKEIAHHLTISFYSKSGIINFEEFVITCWWIVSLNEEEVAKWIFRLFDSDHDDMLQSEEMKHLVQTVGSHNQTSMKGLEACYKHLCFEKVVQNPKPKGPLFHGQPMQPRDPMDDAPKFILWEKPVRLVDWMSDISKKPSLLKPMFELQAMLREKTVKAKFLKWREFRHKTFGTNLTLDEIVERLGTGISYKPQPKCHTSASTSGKGTSHGTASMSMCASGKGSDKSSGQAKGSDKSAGSLGRHLESAIVVEEQAETVKPLHFHAERRPSTAPATDSVPSHHRRASHDLNNHGKSDRSTKTTRGSLSMSDKEKVRPTTASAAQAAHNSHGHTPQITPRSNKEKVHPTTASAALSANNSQNNTPQVTPRSHKEKGPTTASAAQSAPNSQNNTPRGTPRSNRNHDDHHATSNKENLYRDVLAILEQKGTPVKGTSFQHYYPLILTPHESMP